MDRIIKITLSLFVIILVSFVALTGYTGYVENAYRTSLSSTYTYTCTITTDSPLTNLTLFLPVPADKTGNSPVIARFSTHMISGVPDTWNTELYETGKSTMVKITTPSLIPPPGTGPKNPYSITLSATLPSNRVIDTKNPVANSPMFRPVLDLNPTECKDSSIPAKGGKCFKYVTALYADYAADPNAAVTVTSTLSGTNSWTIFEPRSNEYHTSIYWLMFGPQKEWTNVAGYLESGIGASDAQS
jgi:hypothetical protein